MDSQANNLYETASKPDTDNNAYTFLEFNTQGEDFDYPEFQELSQLVRSSVCPTPSDAPDRASSGHQSDASPVSATSGKGRGRGAGGGGGGGGGSSSGGNQAAVDALASGMSGLNFEETGDDESYENGKGDFMEHAYRYCGLQNPACVVRCEVSSYRRKWFCNSRLG